MTEKCVDDYQPLNGRFTDSFLLFYSYFPKYDALTLKERGINVALYSPDKKVLECVDIRKAMDP